MQILDIIRQAQDGLAIENLAAAFQVDGRATDAAVAAIVPEVAERLERVTLSRGGLADLVRALGDPRHRRALNDPSVFVDPAVGEDGTRILGHIFPTTDAVRAAASRAAARSGLDVATVGRMLPYIAALTMSGLAKALIDGLGSAQGRIPGIEGRELGGDDRDWRPQGDVGMGGGPLSMPGQPGRASPPYAPAPTRDPRWPGGMGGGQGGVQSGGQGPGPGGPFPLPEITGYPMPGGSGGPGGGGGRLPGPMDVAPDGRSGQSMPGPGRMPYPMPGPQGGSPMPGPQGGQNPLDDLSDIIRRRGATTTDGSPLGGIIRSILGAILGFRSGGFMSWIFRLVFMRFGWSILRRVLGRMLTGGR